MPTRAGDVQSQRGDDFGFGHLGTSGLKGQTQDTDLWAHQNLGSFRDAYSAQVPVHGVVLLRIAR